MINFKKKIATLGMAAAVVFTTVFGSVPTTTFAADSDADLKPVTDIEVEAGSENGLAKIHINNQVDGKSATNSKYSLLKGDDEIPATYRNSATQAIMELPSTRDQNPYGTCWAFSSTSMMENSMIAQGLATKSVDYSELQLAYFTFHSAKDPLALLNDKNSFTYPYDGKYLDMGGNRYVSSRTLMTWAGSTDEKTVPYSSAYQYVDGGLSSKYAYNYDVAKLNEFYMVPIHPNAGLELAKICIMEYGSMGIDYEAGVRSAQSTCTYNGETIATYYMGSTSGSNHAVTVVGWDDNFPASNFASRPAGNGAWLVRNSWTTDATDTASGYGYFWLSYYDASLLEYDENTCGYIFGATKASTYTRNYQYDGGYFVDSVECDAAANVFKAQNNEKISAVTLSNWYTNPGTYDEVTVSIYTDLKSKNNPTSGTKALSETVGVISGQQSIALSKAVNVSKGSYFAVVIKSSIGRYDIEYSYGSTSSLGFYTTVKASGNSYFKNSSKWYNTTKATGYGDFSIKALTKKGSSVPATAAISSAKNSKAKSVVVKWKKISGAKGYEIQYSTSSKFKSAKTLKVSKGTATSATIKKLKKGKTYYVRIRTKNSKGKSNWSLMKSVKIKK